MTVLRRNWQNLLCSDSLCRGTFVYFWEKQRTGAGLTARGRDDHRREDKEPFRHMNESCGHVGKIHPSSLVASFPQLSLVRQICWFAVVGLMCQVQVGAC